MGGGHSQNVEPGLAIPFTLSWAPYLGNAPTMGFYLRHYIAHAQGSFNMYVMQRPCPQKLVYMRAPYLG
jgi:hypothetical protein